ncbi:hypothetical protein T09_1266 [Trichinella sp. T9]|nr:hypothetical protein T09_1266 [Trichinella sp. T9]
MNEPEFKQQYQIGVLQPGEAERRMASVGLPLAVLIKQKWGRGLITSELNFNSFSISSSSAFSSKDLIQQVLECGGHFIMDFANRYETLFKVLSDGIRLGSAIFFTAVALKSRFRDVAIFFCSWAFCQNSKDMLISTTLSMSTRSSCKDKRQSSLKPVVHRVTTINGNEQSLQRWNLYRRKPAEAGSRILRKNYSKTYMVGKAAPENIRRADADQPWTILTEKRLRLASSPPPWDYLHGRYNLCCLFDPFYNMLATTVVINRTADDTQPIAAKITHRTSLYTSGYTVTFLIFKYHKTAFYQLVVRSSSVQVGPNRFYQFWMRQIRLSGLDGNEQKMDAEMDSIITNTGSARSEKELRQFLYFVILFNGVFCEMAVEFVPKEFEMEYKKKAIAVLELYAFEPIVILSLVAMETAAIFPYS